MTDDTPMDTGEFSANDIIIAGGEQKFVFFVLQQIS